MNPVNEKLMRPYVYWVGRSDSRDEDTPDYSNTYYFLCIIVAHSCEEALSWGDHESLAYKGSDENITIEKSWVEPFIPSLITREGAEDIDWVNWARTFNDAPRYLYHHGSASVIGSNFFEIVNGIIRGLEGEMAGVTWKKYIAKNHPELKFENCDPILHVPVVLIGEPITW